MIRVEHGEFGTKDRCDACQYGELPQHAIEVQRRILPGPNPTRILFCNHCWQELKHLMKE